jgi:hypothetical protein
MAYHSHDFEFETLGGRCRTTSSRALRQDLVHFELDLFWANKASATRRFFATRGASVRA